MNRKAFKQMVKVAKQPNHNGKYFQKLVKEDVSGTSNFVTNFGASADVNW